MFNSDSGYYLHATSRQNGALGIINVYASEMLLCRTLDMRLGGTASSRGNLEVGELRYGWLTDVNNEKLDEVMLAKPVREMRIVMTHGGRAVRNAMDAFLSAAGLVHMADDAGIIPVHDELLDILLASAITETQVAALLEARAAGGRNGLPSDILMTHRILLAGPPNAGKSSLLNCLAGYERAFVHSEVGATRDVVDELVDLGGYAVLVGDLPGFSPQGGELDFLAWEKAAIRLREAEIVFFVVDGSIPWNEEASSAARAVRDAISPDTRILLIMNKSDLPCAIDSRPWDIFFPRADCIHLSSLPGGDAREALDRKVHGILAKALQ